jgi:hypothetical protein
MAILTPTALSRHSTARARIGSAITALSVTSRVSRSAGHLGCCDKSRDFVQQRVAGHAGRRHIHGHAEIHAGRAPDAGLSQRFGENPRGQLRHQGRVFGQRDELGRRNEPALGMVPAQQGLHTLDGPRAQVELGLIDERELSAARPQSPGRAAASTGRSRAPWG